MATPIGGPKGPHESSKPEQLHSSVLSGMINHVSEIVTGRLNQSFPRGASSAKTKPSSLKEKAVQIILNQTTTGPISGRALGSIKSIGMMFSSIDASMRHHSVSDESGRN